MAAPDLADAGFNAFLLAKLGTGDEGLRSYTTSRSWQKQGVKLWEEYKATAPAPAPAAATTVESDDEGTSDVEDSSSMTDAMSDDKSSDLELGSVSSGSTSSVVTKSHDLSDPSSSSSSSSSDSGEASGGDGNGNGLSAADAYILEQGWVPDAQSLHSFKSSRKYETKFLPLIEEALSKASKVAAASAAPTLEQAVNAVILERNPTLSAEDLDSYKTSRGYLKKKDEIEQEAQKRLAAPAPVATTTPEEEAKDAAYEKALVEVILEQNPTLTMSDVETYKTSRAFKKKRAQYEEEVNTRLGIAPEEAPSAVAAAAAATASAVPTKHVTEKERIEKVRRERLEAEYGGSYGETTCDAILLTNIPSSWVCGELESLETSLGALRTMIEKTSGDAGSSRELSALQAKLRKISGEHTSLLKKKKTLLDNLKKTAGLGEELKGLKSIRSICVGEGHFVGAAMLRYDNAGTAAAAYTVMRAKQINPSHAAHPVCTFATSKGVPLSASLLRPPAIPETHADGEFAPYLLAPPPDQKNEKPKRKFPDRGGKGEGGKGGKGSKGGEEHSWWEGEFSAKKQKMTESGSSAVTFEIHPAEQEAKAAKAEAKAEKVATSKTFDEFLMAKMDITQESLDSYKSSRKFGKVKDTLEAEYKVHIAA